MDVEKETIFSPSNLKRQIRLLTAGLAICISLNSPQSLTAALHAEQSPEDTSKQKVTAQDILTRNTKEEKEFIVRKYNFIQELASTESALTGDQGITFELQTDVDSRLYLSPTELRETHPRGADPIGDEIRRRYTGIPPTVSLSQLLQRAVNAIKASQKKVSVSELPIPTNLEIDILKLLWVKWLATSSDVYASLDTTWLITSEDLNKVLESMADRGFLDRKKISPSDEFNLFGIISIEKNPLNRKNKQYVYWPVVPKEKLIKYIDAQRYLAFVSANNGSQYSSNGYYRMLQTRLYRLARSD